MSTDIEFRISAVFLDGSKRVLVHESNQMIMDQIPDSRLRVNRHDSGIVMNSADGVIIVLGGVSSLITIGQAIYFTFKKLLPSHKWSRKPELIVQVNDAKGNFAHLVLNEELGTEEEFIMKFKNEVDIKIVKRHTPNIQQNKSPQG